MTENVSDGSTVAKGGVNISDRKLRKALTTTDLLFLSLGGIIGSGWLFAAASAAELTGPSAVLSWIIGGVIVLIIALVYAELGGMIPRSGAIVRYGKFSHGSLAGYLFGWAYFLSAVSVPAVEAEAVITYAGSYIPGLDYVALAPDGATVAILKLAGILLAALLMVGFFFLNYFGVRVMGKTNTGMTWWKLIIPLGTIAILLVFHFNVSNFFLSTGFFTYHVSHMFEAISVSGIVFSFLGFRQALDYGGEAKTPQKSIPIATIVSVLIGIAIYVMLQVVFIGQINWTALGVTTGSWANLGITSAGAALVSAPFATLMSSAGLVIMTYILFADAYISPSGTLNVYLGTSQRTLYGMGTLGYLGKRITKLNEHHVPVLPLLVTLLVGFVFFAPFPSWYELVGFITSSTVFTYIVGGSALRVFRREAKELNRPFTLKGSAIISPMAFVGATLIVYWSGWPIVPYVVIAILLGLIVYFVYRMAGKTEIDILSRQNLKGGGWLLVFMGVLTLLSYLGEKGYGGIGVLPFPWDFLVVIIVAVGFYIWSVKSGFKTEEITEMIASGTQYVEEQSEASGGK